MRTRAATPAGLLKKLLPSLFVALGEAPTWARADGGTFMAATCALALAARVGLAVAACFWGAATAGAANVNPSKRARAPARGLAHEVRLMPSSCPVRAWGPAEPCLPESARQGRSAQRNEFAHDGADLVPAIDRNLTRSNRRSCRWRVLYPFGRLDSSRWIAVVDGM